MSDLASSDSDINGGDLEDNVSDDDSLFSSKEHHPHRKSGSAHPSSSDDESNERSLSFTSESKKPKEEEFNLNLSFTGGYVPNTDLTRVDKGQGNP